MLFGCIAVEIEKQIKCKNRLILSLNVIFYAWWLTLIACCAFNPEKFGLWMNLEQVSALAAIVLLIFAVLKLRSETKSLRGRGVGAREKLMCSHVVVFGFVIVVVIFDRIDNLLLEDSIPDNISPGCWDDAECL